MKYLKKALALALIILALLATPACNAQAKTQESGKTSTRTDAKTTLNNLQQKKPNCSKWCFRTAR